MGLLDYILPWKAIPNMARDVKSAFGGEGKNRHDSFLGAIGKYADPAGALMGDKWMNFFHGTIPREVNRALEPVGQFHRNLDPIYQFGGKNTQVGRDITNLGMGKGGDISALVAAAVVGGGALGGAGGGAGGGSSGWGSMMGMPSMPQQQPQQQMPMQRRPMMAPPVGPSMSLLDMQRQMAMNDMRRRAMTRGLLG